MENNQNDPDADANALETTPETQTTVTPTAAAPIEKPKPSFKQKIQKFNIYLIAFMFILTLGIGLVLIAYFQGQKTSGPVSIASQNLTQEALDTLASTDASVGDPKQLLNVQSNAVFSGQILVRGAVEVAGNLRVAGTTLVNTINSTGAASFETAQVNQNLSVGGDSALQGSLAVQDSLQVNGGGTFGGPVTAAQITTNAFELNGDLRLTSHIVAGGPSPSRTNGTALGSGGTSSVGGSDTGGTLAVNTGSGPSAGCFATVTFAKRYNTTPRVLVTPVGDAAGGIDYYINRTTTTFSICTATPPPAGASFAFDYFVVE